MVGPRVRRQYGLVASIWAAWVVAVLGVVIGGVESGAIADPLHSWVHYGGPLWPLFTWDFGWYHGIAITGYPPGPLDPITPQYAFFPLWPLLLRASGSVPDWIAAFAVTLVASAGAFAGVAAALPSGRGARAAAVLACWPASFLLLLAYPDVIALAAAAWAAALALRGRPWAAGVLAGVAAVARPTGVLVAIPLALAARGSRAGRIFAAAVPIAAAAAVQAYFWERSDDPRAFFHAQSLPIWQRAGPARLTKWPGHVAEAISEHALLVVVGALLTVAVAAFVAQRLGRWHAVALVYVFVVAVLLLGAQSTQSRIQSAILAFVAPVLLLCWSLGRAYRPWALFATAVVAVSIFSGSVTSFGRQALFAFPLYWAVADGPRALRHPLVALAAIAANVAYALTLAKYAP